MKFINFYQQNISCVNKKLIPSYYINAHDNSVAHFSIILIRINKHPNKFFEYGKI